jgi:hypothetical protein
VLSSPLDPISEHCLLSMGENDGAVVVWNIYFDVNSVLSFRHENWIRIRDSTSAGTAGMMNVLEVG